MEFIQNAIILIIFVVGLYTLISTIKKGVEKAKEEKKIVKSAKRKVVSRKSKS